MGNRICSTLLIWYLLTTLITAATRKSRCLLMYQPHKPSSCTEDLVIVTDSIPDHSLICVFGGVVGEIQIGVEVCENAVL